MADTKFIKTVTYGGYEKEGVREKLNALYRENARLTADNEVKTALYESVKAGKDINTAAEELVEKHKEEVVKLTADNEEYRVLLDSLEEENAGYKKRISELEASVTELGKALADTKGKLDAASGGDAAAALGAVFIEAQKSANSLKEEAQKQADKIQADAKALAEDIVTEANNDAANIVYEAEKQAIQTTAEAKNSTEELRVASNNLKSVIIGDVELIAGEIAGLKAILKSVAETGMVNVSKAEDILENTKKTLTEGGIPKFIDPKIYVPELPEAPTLQKSNSQKAEEQKEKTNEALEKLKNMAGNLASDEKKDESKEEPKKGGIDLASLAQQAAALGGEKKEEPKKSGIDLASLAQQAADLGGEKKEEPKKSGVDLAALAQQAEALNKDNKNNNNNNRNHGNNPSKKKNNRK